MKLLKSQDLYAAGYPPGPRVAAMLAKAAEYATRGISNPKYVLKLLQREFGPPPPKAEMREQPAPLAEAIQALSQEEQYNVAAVRRQMGELLKAPPIVRGALMPDACPAGPGVATMPVGAAIAVEGAILPAAHSADICCSMFATLYHERRSSAEEMDALMASTRFGQGHRPLDDLVFDPVLDEPVWHNRFLTGLRKRAHAHLADQGDGNHFAFLGKLEVTAEMRALLQLTGHGELATALAVGGNRVLVTHHGSRSLGAHVFKRGLAAAVKQVEKIGTRIPENAAWLEADSPEGQEYWEALQYVSRWTQANHRAIHRRFLERIGATAVAQLGNEHNFVWRRGDLFYHGKGATPAWRDDQGRPQLGLIPLNLAQPILLVLGSDHEEFLSFAPHGAGRNLSRTALRRQFRAAKERQHLIERSTAGLDVRWFCGDADISELPVAYKDAAAVRAQIEEFQLAQVVAEIQPLGCVMAGDSGRSWRDREEVLTPKQKRQIQHRKERRKVRRELHEGYG